MSKLFEYRCSKCGAVIKTAWHGRSYRGICNSFFPADKCTMSFVPGQRGFVLAWVLTLMDIDYSIGSEIYMTRSAARKASKSAKRDGYLACSGPQRVVLEKPQRRRGK